MNVPERKRGTFFIIGYRHCETIGSQGLDQRNNDGNEQLFNFKPSIKKR
jgi:hypothetical protein